VFLGALPQLAPSNSPAFLPLFSSRARNFLPRWRLVPAPLRRDVSLRTAALLAEPLHRALLVRQVAPWPCRALCSSSLSFPSARRLSQPPRAMKLPGCARMLHRLVVVASSMDSSALSCAGFLSSRRCASAFVLASLGPVSPSCDTGYKLNLISLSYSD
jgi:hypothetical protein